jgi:hypothetical protein
MPGTFQVGLNAEHTQATLPGGTEFNWGNDTDAANRGVAPNSGGAWMPGFTQHFYRPVGAGGVPGSVSPGGVPSSPVSPAATPSYGGGQSFPIPLPVTVVGGLNIPSGGAPGQPPGTPAPGGAPAAPGTPGAPGAGGAPSPGGGAPGDPFGPANTNPGLNNPPAPAPSPLPGSTGVGPPGPGTAPSQNPLDIFGPGAGHPGPPQVGGGGNAFGAGGPGAGATQIGGVDPLQGKGAGGVGMAPGGSLDTALGLAASAVPGLGQAAQTGAKLASRAIQYGGQVAGIMTQGALDTWLPFGGSKLAQNGWLTRIVGGLAGASPALPNMAGKPATPGKDQGQQGQGQGGQAGDTNITVNNNRATEDGTGKDIAWHQQQAQLPAAKP